MLPVYCTYFPAPVPLRKCLDLMNPSGSAFAPGAEAVLLQKAIAVASEAAIVSPGVLGMKRQNESAVTLIVFPSRWGLSATLAENAHATSVLNVTRMEAFMVIV